MKTVCQFTVPDGRRFAAVCPIEPGKTRFGEDMLRGVENPVNTEEEERVVRPHLPETLCRFRRVLTARRYEGPSHAFSYFSFRSDQKEWGQYWMIPQTVWDEEDVFLVRDNS